MDKLKVRLVKVAVCIIATAGQNGIGNAVCQQGFQPHGEIQVIQIFQKTVLPGVAKFFQIIRQIVLRNDLAHGTNLFNKGSPSFTLNLERVADGFQHSILVSRLHPPELRLLGTVPARVGIRHIKDIFEPCLEAGIVQQSNTTGTPIHPAIHLFVPKFNGSAGRYVRTLGMD
ncbi:hypothetical protein [Intestinimonas butyriciproducens]|uniref:hypothetical protein n=1 Tax=Intestinimonas butyriciproducens TaxID=1297617 RepID=UPI0019563B59|nr:hypothetical protein [Intestinimonas butyriciproducens]MBM6974948.1 hypothetical protein [Intestinimonas butyriciproducens]